VLAQMAEHVPTLEESTIIEGNDSGSVEEVSVLACSQNNPVALEQVQGRPYTTFHY
jgi:hypothetical protein